MSKLARGNVATRVCTSARLYIGRKTRSRRSKNTNYAGSACAVVVGERVAQPIQVYLSRRFRLPLSPPSASHPLL